jgi:hypothetical protein
MQRYIVYFIWKLLYMFRVVPPYIRMFLLKFDICQGKVKFSIVNDCGMKGALVPNYENMGSVKKPYYNPKIINCI